jgi:hypothetical protein
MTLHRRTLHWFRRFGIAPAIRHYMVKNVLIGKNAAAKGRKWGTAAWFVALRFILPEASWLTARFREHISG